MSEKTDSPDSGKPSGRDARGRFVAGNNGGPGRPKGSASVITSLRRVMESKRVYSAEKVAEAALRLAILGDMRAIEYVTDRIDGKPAQAITGADGGPFRFTFDIAKPDDNRD